MVTLCDRVGRNCPTASPPQASATARLRWPLG